MTLMQIVALFGELMFVLLLLIWIASGKRQG